MWIGLGDTNYDQFCESGKIVDAKMKVLGGLRAKALGMADEGTGLEQVVEPWIDTVMDDLRKAVGFSEGGTSNQNPAFDGKSEEKKEEGTEVGEEKIGDDVEVTISASSSTGEGIMALQSLATTLSIPLPLPQVPLNALPSLGASLSSCQLLSQKEHESYNNLSASEPDENMTMTSTSSCQFNHEAPYESIILSAKYVTNTSVEPAKKALISLEMKSSNLKDVLKFFDEGFPLDGADSRNARRVIQMELSLPDDFSLQYAPGDSIAVLVDNDLDAVDIVLNMLKTAHAIEPEQPVLLDESRTKTVRDVLSRDIDISSTLKQRSLCALSQHATNVEEGNALQLLSSKSDHGLKLYKSFIEDQMINIADLLIAFPSCTPSLEALVGILPSVAPRYYSIASSPLANPKSLSVAFSVVDIMTPSAKTETPYPPRFSSRRKKGLATRYLEAILAPLLAGSKSDFKIPCLRIFPKPTQEFKLPLDNKTPLLLIGPGTGVAPFIGFLEHRREQKKDDKKLATKASQGTWRGGFEFEEGDIPVTNTSDSDMKLGAEYRLNQGYGEIELFFGCRYSDHDWLFKEEMRSFCEEGVLTRLHTAFSRDNPNQKVYVQHKLQDEANGQRIVNLLTQEGASVYICGDGNAMAKDVQNALCTLLGRAVEDPEKFLMNMKANKKLVLDIWS